MSNETLRQIERRALFLQSVEKVRVGRLGVWADINGIRNRHGERWLAMANRYDSEIAFLSVFPTEARLDLEADWKCPYQSAAAVVLEVHDEFSAVLESEKAIRAAVEYIHQRARAIAPWMQTRELTSDRDRWSITRTIQSSVAEQDLKAVAEMLRYSRVIW